MTDNAIAKLFERRERAVADLARADAALNAARNDYATRRGLRVLPRLETMKREVRP